MTAPTEGSTGDHSAAHPCRSVVTAPRLAQPPSPLPWSTCPCIRRGRGAPRPPTALPTPALRPSPSPRLSRAACPDQTDLVAAGSTAPPDAVQRGSRLSRAHRRPLVTAAGSLQSVRLAQSSRRGSDGALPDHIPLRSIARQRRGVHRADRTVDVTETSFHLPWARASFPTGTALDRGAARVDWSQCATSWVSREPAVVFDIGRVIQALIDIRYRLAFVLTTIPCAGRPLPPRRAP